MTEEELRILAQEIKASRTPKFPTVFYIAAWAIILVAISYFWLQIQGLIHEQNDLNQQKMNLLQQPGQ